MAAPLRHHSDTAADCCRFLCHAAGQRSRTRFCSPRRVACMSSCTTSSEWCAAPETPCPLPAAALLTRRPGDPPPMWTCGSLGGGGDGSSPGPAPRRLCSGARGSKADTQRTCPHPGRQARQLHHARVRARGQPRVCPQRAQKPPGGLARGRRRRIGRVCPGAAQRGAGGRVRAAGGVHQRDTRHVFAQGGAQGRATTRRRTRRARQAGYWGCRTPPPATPTCAPPLLLPPPPR